MKIRYVDRFVESDSPARVYRDLGLIEINLSRWLQLPKPYRDYILAHEEGHWALNTTDEMKADEYAFKKLAGKAPYSLRNSILTLYDVLPFTTPEQHRRLEAAELRALKYSARNGNKEAMQLYVERTGKNPDAFDGRKAGKNAWLFVLIIIVIIWIIKNKACL
ncbi:MAG: DUF3318 domain-containing protein [Bacteroidales bacterium]|nr:DUF3318 domain-containing protein [Bacteroidales bacterium]